MRTFVIVCVLVCLLVAAIVVPDVCEGFLEFLIKIQPRQEQQYRPPQRYEVENA